MLNYNQHPSRHVNRRINRSQVPAAKDFAFAMNNVINEAKKHLLATQQRQKSYVDTKRHDMSYEMESEMFFTTSNIKLKTLGARKLLPRWIGPFEIVKRFGVVTFHLKLPDNIGIHNVFNVFFLKPYNAYGRVKPPPLPVIENHDILYGVECVLENMRLEGVIPVPLNSTSSSGSVIGLSITIKSLNLI